MTDDERLPPAKERRWREVGAIDAAYERGELDDAAWHEAMRRLVEPVYLAAATVQGGSGHSGDATRWRYARSLLLDALPGDCDVLDVGCANGLLMESLSDWGRERGWAVEPYGVEISPALTDVARRRLPHWAGRIWTGNAATWSPPRSFDVVRTGLDYVPTDRRVPYLQHLVRHAVSPGGRLVVGVQNSEPDDDTAERLLQQAGLRIDGGVRRPHRVPPLEYTAVWGTVVACRTAARGDM